MKRKFRAISLFSGAGGMDQGFRKAGFTVVWANDFNHYHPIEGCA